MYYIAVPRLQWYLLVSTAVNIHWIHCDMLTGLSFQLSYFDDRHSVSQLKIHYINVCNFNIAVKFLKNIFFTWLPTLFYYLTFDLEGNVKLNQHAEYLGQKNIQFLGYFWVQMHRHTRPTGLLVVWLFHSDISIACWRDVGRRTYDQEVASSISSQGMPA